MNSDGEGGGEFVQQGNLIRIERVGPLLYFNAPRKFWAAHATAAQTKAYGGKWIEFSAVDSRFTSFDQFLDAADLVVAAFQGHTAPLTLGRPTTFAGHKVVVVKDTVANKGKRSTGLMYIARHGPAPRVQDRRPDPRRREHGRLQPLRQGRGAHRPAQRRSTSHRAARRVLLPDRFRRPDRSTRRAEPELLEQARREPWRRRAGRRHVVPRWSSRSGRYSPITPARIGSGIDCSQIRPGPVEHGEVVAVPAHVAVGQARHLAR